MRSNQTPHLQHGDFPDGIVPQDSNEGAVLYFSAQPNMGMMSGGNEIKFRGGAFRTSHPDVKAFLDWQVDRNIGIYREEAAQEVKPGATAPLNDETAKMTAETTEQGKSNASSVPPVQAQLAGKTGIATSLTAPQ
jgi:hypothetical protein